MATEPSEGHVRATSDHPARFPPKSHTPSLNPYHATAQAGGGVPIPKEGSSFTGDQGADCRHNWEAGHIGHGGDTVDRASLTVLSGMEVECKNLGTTPDLAVKPVDGFQSRVQAFMAENATMFDVLAKQVVKEEVTKTPTLHNFQEDKTREYAEPEALEFHMNVHPFVRERRLFELVRLGDMVEGYVTSKEFKELDVRVTSFVGSHKFREMGDINIYGRVSPDNLSDKGRDRERVFEEMQLRDVVQGVVVGRYGDVLSLSFKESHVEQFCPNGELPIGAHLGYKSGRVARQTGRQLRNHSDDFLRHLENDPGFSNPSCSDNLKVLLGIRSEISGMESLSPGMRPTLFSDMQMAQYPSSDCHQELRKVQRSKWSMDTVAIGVKCFKSGEEGKAMKMLDHALDIDRENVEGLVARGALYANGGRFKDGIRDFEKALTLKPTHRNAKKYLVETHVAYGEDLEKRGRIEEAIQCYREALADDPNQTMAREHLETLTALAEKQAAERREKERKKAEEEKTLRKIQKFLDMEREKKSKKTSKKGKKKKVKKKPKRTSTSSKLKAKRSRKDSRSSHRYTPSDSESTYSESFSESDRSYSSGRSTSSDRERRYHRGRHHSPRTSSRRSRDKTTSYSESSSSPPCKRRTTDSDSSPTGNRKRKTFFSPKRRSSPPRKRDRIQSSSYSPQEKQPSKSGHQSSLDSTSSTRASSSKDRQRDRYSSSRTRYNS